MKLIDNKLVAENGFLLKDKKDKEQMLEDGTAIKPYLTNVIYLAKQIDTLDKAKKLYEEVECSYD